MKLDEIKNGMYVKLRSGTLALVLADKFMYENGNYNERRYYINNTLTHTVNQEWDIMEVYVSSSPNIFDENKLERIWVRDTFEPHIGDIYYNEDCDKYVAIFRIDDDDMYPYVALRYCKGDFDLMEIEPFSAEELSKFKFVKNSDKLSLMDKLTKELCNGTI